MTSESSLFSHRWLPALLAAPLLLLILIFFYAPIVQAFYWSFFLERPFGGGSEFVGWDNFRRVLADPEFWNAGWRTIIFMVFASSLAVALPLILAVAADRKIRLSLSARNVLVWPKGVAGASSASSSPSSSTRSSAFWRQSTISFRGRGRPASMALTHSSRSS